MSDEEAAAFDEEWERQQASDEARARRDPIFARELEIYDEFVRDGFVLLGTEAAHYRAIAHEQALAELAVGEFPPPPPGRLRRAIGRLFGD